MKQAAAYVRVSTDKQADEKTYETQIDEIKRKVEKDGHILSDQFIYLDDGWSGAYLERPALDQLRQDAREQKFNVLYVYDKGRLSRIFVHQEIVIEELLSYDIEFVSLHDINGSTPEEKVMGGVMGLFHEYERVKTAERFRLAKLNKVRHGNLLGYNPPYGYDYVPVQGKGSTKVNGYFVINEEEAKVVRMMYEWVGVEGISLREVIRRLYEKGIPPKKAKRATWTKGPIARLLSNETYVGRHHYNKREGVIPKNPSPASEKKYKNRHTNKTSRRLRDRSEWLEVKVPAIIEESLYRKVQTQLQHNARFSQRNKKHNYLFGGLVWCSCGAKRVGDGPAGKKYYRCTDRLHNFPLPAVCKVGGANVAVLDSIGWQKIAELLTNPNLIEKQIGRYSQKQVKKIGDKQNDNTIVRSLKLLEDEERRYVKMYGLGRISEAIYEEQIESVLKRRQDLQTKATEATDGQLEKFQNVDAQQMAKAFSGFVSKLDYEHKLFTVRKIVDKVIATKEEVTICGFIPTEKEVLHAINSNGRDRNIPNNGRGKVGLRAINRNSRLAQCRQVYTF
ncbi:MAG TPA: recombinase family protein [Candidatus Saccharibacteria bacterium]|nr:recombinase family protein [Candidatus Saccharibacteria bacterium]HMT39782.1 recombinase family protein [Candidatus Saccharibacteria bacterium]